MYYTLSYLRAMGEERCREFTMAITQHTSFSNALILQGDWEGGLSNFALDLMDAGKKVSKVILHASDWIYKRRGIPTMSFDAPIELFEDWLHNQIKQHGIDCIILYNQYRPYNLIGWNLAKELDIECIVLELGLLRPDFCSIFSRSCDQFDYLAQKWNAVLHEKQSLRTPDKPPQLGSMSTPCKMTQFAIYYSFSRFMAVFARQYRHYIDQRKLDYSYHLAAGIRAALRFQGRDRQHRYDAIFSNEWSGKYYLVPLQVHTDSQITERSNFESMEEFIRHVVDSFEKHAPPDTKLVFKVHPMDRGYTDYHHLIESLQAKAGEHRILYLDRIHLPTALEHARACITINSSVGLSALMHETPVITLGDAAYDLKGLTYRGELDDFWTQQGTVNETNIHNFVALLKQTSQAQGTLYQRLYAAPGRCKIAWPEEYTNLFTEQSELMPPALKEQPPEDACHPHLNGLTIHSP